MYRKKSQINTKKYTCEYCEKSFTRENTLLTHKCMQRDRYHTRDETHVKIAYSLWKSMNSLPEQYKTIEYFEKNKTYKMLTEFAKFAEDSNYLFIYEYGSWLIKNKVIERNWYKLEIYQQFLKQYLLTENPRDAVLRSVEYVSNIHEIGNFLKTCQVGKILTYIETGRISPWLIFLADNKDDFLKRLENEKMEYFFKLVNVDIWNSRMKRYSKTINSLKNDMKGINI